MKFALASSVFLATSLVGASVVSAAPLLQQRESPIACPDPFTDFPLFVTAAGGGSALSAGEMTSIGLGGGTPPYTLLLGSNGETGDFSVLYDSCTSTQYQWDTYVPEGTNITFKVTDSTGRAGFSQTYAIGEHPGRRA